MSGDGTVSHPHGEDEDGCEEGGAGSCGPLLFGALWPHPSEDGPPSPPPGWRQQEAPLAVLKSFQSRS